MFGNEAFDRVRQLFADQFEPNGNNFVYRKSMKGAPILVSPEERSKYIETYSKFSKYGHWGIVGSTVILLSVFVLYSLDNGTEISNYAIWVVMGLVVAAYIAAHRWAWNLPARELRGRGTVGKSRSRAEVQRIALSRTTYRQLATGVGIVAVALFEISLRENLLSGWNRLWLDGAGLAVVVAGVQVFRKWRFESLKK